MGATVGPHSHAARLAGALLGELLYESGELAEAIRLLDESYQLGSEGGEVDYMIAGYVIGARIKAAQGDHRAAADRLAEGMKAAEQLGLPRLAAAINNERVRLGIELAPEVAARLRATCTIPHDDEIATITAELDENSGIRLLSTSHSADDRKQACRRAADLLAGINGEQRPLTELNAQLLLAETLMTSGRSDEVNAVLPRVAARCDELGLPRLLVDAGLRPR
jgi:ATP/maltotriose-dependent transcriptional regulator MalT